MYDTFNRKVPVKPYKKMFFLQKTDKRKCKCLNIELR